MVNGTCPPSSCACLVFAAAYASTQHPDYAVLAARVAVSNLHKSTMETERFSVLFDRLASYTHPKVSDCVPRGSGLPVRFARSLQPRARPRSALARPRADGRSCAHGGPGDQRHRPGQR